jgi:hypothetical protein
MELAGRHPLEAYEAIDLALQARSLNYEMEIKLLGSNTKQRKFFKDVADYIKKIEAKGL